MKHSVLLMLSCLLLAGLAACQTGSDEPRLVTEWEPTAVGTRPLRPTATPLPTMASQEVPTREPTPEVVSEITIPTLVPSPIPEGVYVRELDGFTLNYPAFWELDDSDSAFLQLTDPVLNLFVLAGSDFIDEESNFEAFYEEITTAEDGFFGINSISLVAEEEIPNGEEGMAQLAIFEGINFINEPVQIYLAYLEEGARAFTMIALGTPKNIASRRTTLDTMVEQVQIGSDRLLGYDRDETLSLLSSEPLPRNLDPALQTGSAAGFVGLLYSGLVQLTPDLKLVPDLAEGWQVSEDGTVYTFTLREGLTFADGRPLTAEDVQYSWERAADPELESTTATLTWVTSSAFGTS